MAPAGRHRNGNAPPHAPGPAAPGLPAPAESRRRTLWRRFCKNRSAAAGLAILILLAMAAVLAPFISPYDPAEQFVGPGSSPPGREHLMGTDRLGRDLFSRVIHASRISLGVGMGVAGISLALGTAVGLTAGYFGGWVDGVLMRLTDVVMTFPFLFFVLTITSLFGPSFWNVVIALGVLSWTDMARIVRAQILSLREREYTEAARAGGAAPGVIIVRHLLPNTAAPIIVFATLKAGGAILAESALSYLGLGVQPPETSWGQLLSDGKQYLVVGDFWYTFFPGLMIFITVLAVNFVGDGLRDALDPRWNRPGPARTGPKAGPA